MHWPGRLQDFKIHVKHSSKLNPWRNGSRNGPDLDENLRRFIRNKRVFFSERALHDTSLDTACLRKVSF
jgi:hypothetical protein